VDFSCGLRWRNGVSRRAANADRFCLLDISMPGMDGIEVCKRLRQMPSTAQTPIVMLTALDTPQRREQSKAAGATDFWVKPFRPTTLVKDIVKIIGSSS
jgi:CheY-like chemotaxis protein